MAKIFIKYIALMNFKSKENTKFIDHSREGGEGIMNQF